MKKQTKKTANVNNFFAAISAAFEQRLTVCPNDNQRDEVKTAMRFFGENVAIAAEQHFNAEKIARIVAAEKGAPDYICAKTLIKVFRIMQCVAAQSTISADNFIKITVKQMLHFDNHLNIKEIQSSLSRKILRDDVMIDMRESVTAKASYTIGTANSQASKVRKALAALDLATIKERAKNDDAQLTEKGAQLLAIFA